jgi:GPH family glycoside/pentoside/hexuronide:cation symporter
MGLVTLFLGEGVDEINWLLLAGVPSLLAMLVMLPQIFTLQERYHTDVIAQVSLRDMLREVLRNDQHFIMMSFFLSQAFLNAVGVFAVYVSEAYYGDARLATVTSLFTLLGVVGLGIFTPGIVRRYGKKRYLEVSMQATLLLSIPAFFVPGQMAILAMLFLGLRTTTLVVTSLLRPMFTADCVEYGQHKTGVRSDSTAFAIQTFFNKTGDALGVSLGGYILALVLFDETLPLVQQSADTINALQRWYVLLPMLMAAVMYLGPKLFYKLDEATVTKYIQSNRG